MLISLISLISYFLASPVVQFLAGEDFLPAVKVFRILLLGVAGMTFASVMGSQWIGRGMFWQVSVITVASGGVNILASYFIIPEYGMIGAAWITVAIFLLAVLINGVFALWVERNYRKGLAQTQPATKIQSPTSSSFPF